MAHFRKIICIDKKIMINIKKIETEIKKIEEEKETAACELSAAENFLKSI